MKTTKYFFMAALALMTAACSNEDNAIEQQPQMARGIPFTATISMGNSAATRALEEIDPTGDTPNGSIVGKWTSTDVVALIYKVGDTSYKTEATVTPRSDGKATLSATLQSGATDGSDVTIIYPATAADGTTGEVDADVLETQDGTLTGNATSIDKTCDVRKGIGKLSISGVDGYKTATVNNGTAGTYVTLSNVFSIFKFTLQNIKGNDLSVHTLTILDADNEVVKGTITLNAATNVYYVALPELTAGKYWLNATFRVGNNNKPYIAKVTSTATAAGKYYPVTVKMATICDFILSDGTFAAANTTTTTGTPVAMIAYLGKATDNDTYKHGLALAMNDENSGNGLTWSDAQTACNNKTTPSVTNAGTSSWLFPSETQWTNMDYQVRTFYNSPGLYNVFHNDTGDNVSDATNLQYKDTDESHILYWSRTEVKVGESYTSARAFDVYTPNWYNDPKTNGAVTPYKRVCRACLAF